MTLHHRTRSRSGSIFIALSLVILLLAGCASNRTSADTDSRPNVILLLADDLGWNGLHSYGSDLHQTPHLDRLAKQGVRFTNAYAASPVCSPSRAAILTGKAPARLNVTNWIPGFDWSNTPLHEPDWTRKLPLDETTIADVLKSRGYATAHIGKWHLGEGPCVSNPERQGFDVNVGGGSWGSPPGGYFLPNELPLKNVEEGDYLTDHLTDRAVELIRRWNDRPFFLHFAYYVVHTPIQAKETITNRYRLRIETKRKQGEPLTHDNPTYAAMVHTLDQSVGRILDALKQSGVTNETLIIFTSDNGGLSRKFGRPTGITDNAPLRRGKGTGYEGALRVPLIIRWPGHTAAGSVRDALAIGMDLFPTILDAANIAKKNHAPDGRSLLPLLDGSTSSFRERSLFWHFPHYHPGGIPEGPFTAVRHGPWKLLEFHEDPRHELYNLKKDAGEHNNRRAAQPERTEQLRKRLNAWKEKVNAQITRPNPAYNPDKPLREK